MITFLKTQAVSIVGSFADFLATIVLVEVFHCWYVAGNMAGNICGAITQFVLCRDWVFGPGGNKLPFQILKFVIVWIANLGLSAGGVYLITHFAGINYIISKLVTSAVLGVSVNYLLLKKFVFAGNMIR
jgi:putative flippase GtrA